MPKECAGWGSKGEEGKGSIEFNACFRNSFLFALFSASSHVKCASSQPVCESLDALSFQMEPRSLPLEGGLVQTPSLTEGSRRQCATLGIGSHKTLWLPLCSLGPLAPGKSAASLGTNSSRHSHVVRNLGLLPTTKRN